MSAKLSAAVGHYDMSTVGEEAGCEDGYYYTYWLVSPRDVSAIVDAINATDCTATVVGRKTSLGITYDNDEPKSIEQQKALLAKLLAIAADYDAYIDGLDDDEEEE